MKELSKTLQPMTVGDILDRSIQLYRRNFLKFIGIVLFVKGPYLIFAYGLGYVLTKLIEGFLTGTPNASGADATQMMNYEESVNVLSRLFYVLLIAPILIAAMTMAISERFLSRDIGITEAYRKVMRRFLPLLGTILLTGAIISVVLVGCMLLGLLMLMAGSRSWRLMIMIGLILAAVLWIWYTFIPQTVVLEAEGGISAMKRSKYLVKGHFAKAFILLVLVFIAIELITVIVHFSVLKGLFFLGQYSTPLAEGTSNVLLVLLEPFRIAAITLLYYDFRIRKEGFDLEIMAEELESDIRDDYDV